MYLRNGSKYPTEEVRSLIKFAGEPFELQQVCINVRNTPHAFAGYAYRGVPRMSNAPRSAKYLVTLRIGAAHKFTEREVSNVYAKQTWKIITEEDYQRLRAEEGHDRLRVRWRSKRLSPADRAFCIELPEEKVYEVLHTTEKVPYGGKRSPVIHYRNWREALVGVAAHEFKHIEQFQTKKPAAEWQCERAAFNALERYRASLEKETPA